MKKVFAFVSVLVAAVMLLSACGPAATVAPATTEPPTAVPPVATVPPTEVPPTPTRAPVDAAKCPDGAYYVGVHDWSSADRQEYWDQVLKAFNDANDCIKAETVKLPEDRAVRLNELSAGTAPDLVGFDKYRRTVREFFTFGYSKTKELP